jgi:hypothetical protein
MLRYNNDVYENCYMNGKCDLNWFEVFDCMLRLRFNFMYLMPASLGN